MKRKLFLAALALAALIVMQAPEADIGTSLQASSVADTVTVDNFATNWQQVLKLSGLKVPADSNYVRTVEVSGTVQLNRYERFYLGVKINDNGQGDALTADSMNVKWEGIQTYIHGTFQAVLPFHFIYTDTTAATASTDTVFISAAKLGGSQIELANVYGKVSVEAISGQ